MNIELKGGRRRRLFSLLAWRKLVELARCYGWEPGDTSPYLTNDPTLDGNWEPGSRQVSPVDAAGLATALAQALPHIPPYEVTVIRRRPLAGSPSLSALAATTGAQMWSPDPESDPIEFFSGRLRQQLREVITLARAGAFIVMCRERAVGRSSVQGTRSLR